MPPYKNQAPYKGGGSSGRDSSYTQDVNSRGIAAVQERRNRLGYGSPLASQQRVGYMAQTGQNPVASSSVFDEWMSSMVPQGYGIALGQSEDGKYAGFKTEGELKAAIEGAAQTRRASDRNVFDQLYADAGANLDRTMSDWSTGRRNAQSAESDIRAQIGRDMGIVLPSSNESGVGYGTAGLDRSVSGLSSEPTYTKPAVGGDLPNLVSMLADKIGATNDPVKLRAQQSAKLWQAEQPSWQAQNDYQDSLDQWLADRSGKYLDQQEFAQQAANAPLSLYAAQAGAGYGVDPNILAGWFGTNEDNADFTAQRNADAINAYGMPYNEYQSALSGLERDAQAAADQQTAAAETQMNNEVYAITGQDGGQLAQAVNMTPAQVYQMVGDPAFQEYAYTIDAALGQNNYEEAIAAVDTLMQQVGADPAYRKLLDYLYGDVLDAAGYTAEAAGYA